MKVFMIVCFVLILTSCGGFETPKERFVRVACDIYELDECNHSGPRDFCESFSGLVYENNPSYESIECVECFESLGCEMWTHDEKCKTLCEE